MDPEYLADLKYKNWLIKYSQQEGGLSFLGYRFEPEIALQICTCEIDPETKTTFADIPFNYHEENISVAEIKKLATRKGPKHQKTITRVPNDQRLIEEFLNQARSINQQNQEKRLEEMRERARKNGWPHSNPSVASQAPKIT